MQYKSLQTNARIGYSMVEVLVAIAILLLATVGPMTIAARSLQYARYSTEQNTAFFLAQEGIEAFIKARSDQGLQHFNNPTGIDSWGWADVGAFTACRGGGCGIDWSNAVITDDVKDCRVTTTACRIYFDATSARAPYSHNTGGTETPFTRVIAIDNIGGADAVRVRSTVSWAASGSGETRSVILETYLHDIYDTDG